MIGRGILFLGGLLEARTGVGFSDVRRALTYDGDV
jgi:hypothetical protein